MLVLRGVCVGLLVVVFACEGVWVLVSSGVCGCLGVGCVVAGGVLFVWFRGGVVWGGVSVGFGVGGRVFTLGGVSVPVSGSSPAVSGPVSVCGSVVPVSPGAGVGVFGSSGGVGVWCVGVCFVRCLCVWWVLVFFGVAVVGVGCWG